ncbi:MAG: radical SAM protein [Prevotellaceae bacterium]|nr:radical SAM protein [Prevotellaceae bacterium]
MTIADLYQSRKNDPCWNTSYPISPSDWATYRVQGPLSFENDRRLSFYIHIPFCKQLCSFCEYTRMPCPDDNVQRNYLFAIANDIKRFKQQYQDVTLLGFDIGGGTPTSLSEKNFSLLMQIYQTAISGLGLDDKYEPSIEGTFNTLSEYKLEAMVKSGFHRLSLGVQSSCNSVLHQHQRGSTKEAIMSAWLKKAWEKGIKKINLDFMYGLKGQNQSTIRQDIELISRLRPQQVTLYELRTNMISAEESFTKDELYDKYVQYYDGLIALGYYARFGQNTFSVDTTDEGVSSYLRERMLNGAAYKGFGLSAQSMSSSGIAYNVGKLAVTPQNELNKESYTELFTYLLPLNELASKYMAISAYNGSFSIARLRDYGISERTLNEIVGFCIDEGLLYKGERDRMFITPKGFKHYGALFSLFYANNRFN